MSHSKTEIVTGAVVIAVAAGFFLLALRDTGLSRAPDSYELRASFRSAEGVRAGTDVRMAGVKIGSVTAVTLDPVTYRADLRFTVQGGLEIPDDTMVAVAQEGLLGGTFVELVPGGSPDMLASGEELVDTQGAVSLITLLLRFVTGSDEE